MAAREVVIALDQGSSSSRALAFGPRGRVVARAQHSIRSYYPKPGWVEHDADEIGSTLERSLDAVLARLPKAAEISALGLSAQRSTFVLWDAKTGRPLCRAPSWQDGRAAELVEPHKSRQTEVYDKTGLCLVPFYSAPKIRWLIDRVPAVRRALDAGRLRAGPVSTYALWRLTHGAVFAADPSMAQRTMLFNIRTLDWDDDLLRLFGIPREVLPAIAPSAGDWGVVERKGRRIPVRAMLGDQQAAALGLGGDAAGSGVLNYGTGAFFLLNTGSDQRRIPGLLTSVAWQQRGRPCHFFREGTVHAAGTSFQWLKENLGLLKRMDQVDAACRRSQNPFFALQAIGGLGAPRWDYTTFTTYMGISSKTRPEDFVRAVADSVAYFIADIVDQARRAGLTIGHLRASGGLSRVNYLMQFQADLLQSPILQVTQPEATALGAASLAAGEAGTPWAASLRAGASGNGAGLEFKPKMTSGRASRLQEGWRLFVETQQKLSLQLRRLRALP